MSTFATGLFAIAGLINFLPLMGLLGAKRLEAMYGVPMERPDLQVLMQHRAVLFGVVGGAQLWALRAVELRPFTAIIGGISMLAYLVLAVAKGQTEPPLRKILIAGIIGIAALLGWFVLA